MTKVPRPTRQPTKVLSPATPQPGTPSPHNPDPAVYKEIDLDTYRDLVRARRRKGGKIQQFIESERNRYAPLFANYQDKIRRYMEGEDIFGDYDEEVTGDDDSS